MIQRIQPLKPLEALAILEKAASDVASNDLRQIDRKEATPRMDQPNQTMKVRQPGRRKLHAAISEELGIKKLRSVREHLIKNSESDCFSEIAKELNQLGIFCPLDPQASLVKSYFQQRDEYALLLRTLMKDGLHSDSPHVSAPTSSSPENSATTTNIPFSLEKRVLNDELPNIEILFTPLTIIDPEVNVSLYSHRYDWIKNDAEYASMPSVMYVAPMRAGIQALGKVDEHKKVFGQVTSISSNQAFDAESKEKLGSDEYSHAEKLDYVHDHLHKKGNFKKYARKYSGFARSLSEMKERLIDYQKEQATWLQSKTDSRIEKGKMYPNGTLCDNEVVGRVWLWDAAGIEAGGNMQQALVSAIELQLARKSLAIELQIDGINHRLFKTFLLQQLSLNGETSLTKEETLERYNGLNEEDKKGIVQGLIKKLKEPVALCKYSPEKSSIDGCDAVDISKSDVINAIDMVIDERRLIPSSSNEKFEGLSRKKTFHFPSDWTSDRPESQTSKKITLKRSVSLDDISSAAETLHDEMFNNKRKVAFESALATLFMKNPGFFDPVIEKTIPKVRDIVLPALEKVLSYEKNKELAPEPTEAERALFKCFSISRNVRAAYFAYQHGTTGEYPLKKMAPVPKTVEEMEGLVNYYENHVFGKMGDPKTFQEKWTAIRDLGDFVRRPSNFSEEDISLRDVPFIEDAVKADIEERIKDYTDKDRHGIPGLFSSTPPHGSESRAKRLTSSAERHQNTSTYGGIWPANQKRPIPPENTSMNLLDPEQLMTPVYGISGVGVWSPRIAPERTLPSANAREEGRGTDLDNREKDFAYQAMYELDMPLIGGASGGTGGDMLVVRCIGGVNETDELQRAALLSISSMVFNGYHSVHETATIAKIFGAHYQPGNYGSIIPKEWLDTLSELKKLKEQFPDLM